MSAPRTAEVRERIGARLAMMRAADTAGGDGTPHQAYAWALTDVALPLAQQRDAAVAERDALAAEVARLRADIEMFQRSASQAEQTRRDLAAEVARLTKLLDGLAEHAARGSRAALEAAMVAIYDDWRARMAAMAAKGARR